MYASLAHHSSLASSFVSSHLPLVKNTFSSSRSHTHGPTLCPVTTTGPQYGAIRLYAPLPFPRPEMQICGFLAALPLQSLSYAQHLPSQVPGLLVVLATSASLCKKTVCNDNIWVIWVSLFHTANEPIVRSTMAAAPSMQTLMQFSHVSPPCSRYSDVTRSISSPVAFSGNDLKNRKFSLKAFPSTKRTQAKS